MTATDHNKLLGTLIMVRGGILVLVGFILLIGMLGGGMVLMNTGHRHDDHIAGGMMMAGGVIGGLITIGIGLFDLYTGTKIRRVAPIGRTLGLIVCVMSLFSFPLGTVLGVYGLWFFLGDLGKALYSNGAVPATGYDPPQPPPNSWA